MASVVGLVLAVALVAAAGWLLRDRGETSTPLLEQASPATATVEAPPTAAVNEGRPARDGLAEQRAEAPRAQPLTVYVVDSDDTALVMAGQMNDAETVRAAQGLAPLSYRIVVVRAGMDVTAMFAEESQLRAAEGLPPIEVVDVRP